MAFKVTYAIDTCDTNPDIKFFELFSEVEDYLGEEIERRVQWSVDHSQTYVSMRERDELEEKEHCLIKIEEIKTIALIDY
tara:strand:- start:73 stop:312 length:240 start_codon:yes stop_codon:yes gene_type:complete